MATESSTVRMIDHHVSNIPKKTKRSELNEVFGQYGAKVTYFKYNVSKPFAFVDIPENKVDEVLAATIKLGELDLDIKTAFKSIRFFMDTRDTDGELDQVTAEQLEAYFGKYGEVVSARKVDGKGFGFLIMKEGAGYTEIDTDSNHVIGNQIINLSLSNSGNASVCYFLDSRETEGDLDKLSEEQLTSYFATFGSVLEARKMTGKGFGFLAMKKEDGNNAVETLAFQLHTIEGEEINVSEQKNGIRRRGRRRNGKRQNSNRKNKKQGRKNRRKNTNNKKSKKNNNKENGQENTQKQKVIVENQTLEAFIKSE